LPNFYQQCPEQSLCAERRVIAPQKGTRNKNYSATEGDACDWKALIETHEHADEVQTSSSAIRSFSRLSAHAPPVFWFFGSTRFVVYVFAWMIRDGSNR
jgi:hypothetical protein